jgi:cell division septation protein DedD
MNETIDLTKRQIYLFIASSALLVALFFILGIVIGRTMQMPAVVPTAQQLADQVTVVDNQAQLPEILENLPRVTDQSSTKPHVPEEGMTFYERLGKKAPASQVATPEVITTESTLDNTIETTTLTEKIAPLPTEKPSSAPVLTAGSGFSVQVSALSLESDAEALAQKLKSQGYPAYVSPKKYKDGRMNYRVRIGPYGSKSQADEVATQIEKSERRSTWVVSEKADENE